jgi:AraC family transcriptional regulator of adaptative response/methylated-DNA-[protein]-cysteine methyltransferase
MPQPLSPPLADSPSQDYARVAQAIAYLRDHLMAQPTLDDLAAHLGLSPFHVQRLFTRWAGVSPKRFVQALTVAHARPMLAQGQPVLGVAHSLGLSSGSRLHDHFVRIEAMTPGEYQRGGAGLSLGHGVADTPFGPDLLAWTPRGLCHLGFVGHEPSDASKAVDAVEAVGPAAALRARWPRATLTHDADGARTWAQAIFPVRPSTLPPLHVHLQGTPFQLQVWQALLRIAPGDLGSYGQLAQQIGRPSASRAVGQAVGANPVGYLIPCHRVIQQSGAIGGYRWGPDRKRIMLAWEGAQVLSD